MNPEVSEPKPVKISDLEPRQVVLVHELAHLNHPGTPPTFWATVERALPDYERRKNDLLIAGARLWLGWATRQTNTRPDQQRPRLPPENPVRGSTNGDK
ncbi:M48 family metallopeptidase [Natronosporangium hydrolyticum]|uniref:M48 family metallopeptidase n=1 Tax=Natronosporangium hydrolyticum TaxID=2811111 RepID=A0A895YEN5_9ACTN|nr:M48 family metallopeptidase [Natronosporangium hydrolyticum]QSB14605.1 M48 family metallopeptidase [Natronosporangium hydrolyticum]